MDRDFYTVPFLDYDYLMDTKEALPLSLTTLSLFHPGWILDRVGPTSFSISSYFLFLATLIGTEEPLPLFIILVPSQPWTGPLDIKDLSLGR